MLANNDGYTNVLKVAPDCNAPSNYATDTLKKEALKKIMSRVHRKLQHHSNGIWMRTAVMSIPMGAAARIVVSLRQVASAVRISESYRRSNDSQKMMRNESSIFATVVRSDRTVPSFATHDLNWKRCLKSSLPLSEMNIATAWRKIIH